jgi:hypothetical protein
MDPPGLAYSALAKIVQPVSSEALRSLTIGVLPMEVTTSGKIPKVWGIEITWGLRV